MSIWLLQTVQSALNWLSYPSQQPLIEHFKVCSFSYKWTSYFSLTLPTVMGPPEPVQQSGPLGMMEAPIATTLLQPVRDMVRAHL